MDLVDQKIIELIGILKTLKIIRFDMDFCRTLEMGKGNLWNVKNGNSHFTVEQIQAICKEYKVNTNWIFGFSDKIFFTHEFDPRLSNIEVSKKLTH